MRDDTSEPDHQRRLRNPAAAHDTSSADDPSKRVAMLTNRIPITYTRKDMRSTQAAMLYRLYRYTVRIGRDDANDCVEGNKQPSDYDGNAHGRLMLMGASCGSAGRLKIILMY